ncbi:MAG: tRNA-binding protein [Anaerolineae bacterium]|nr:tRNA-binding protein [Anaerolineae bacterium]NUQ05743.1 tRNA-binding protein [Anaerolineae bacterium]
MSDVFPPVAYEDFAAVDMRIGMIVEVQDFPRARKPSYKLRIHFGDAIGERWSSAQVAHYPVEDLIGRQVIAVINLPPRNIAGFLSECLVLGVPTAEGTVSLLAPTLPPVIGGRVY